MNELETDLRNLFQARIADAERLVDLMPGVHRRARRTVRRRMGAGALAGVALIAAVVVPAVARQATANSAAALVAGQHEPPRGWVAVDYGTAQIFVPPPWLVSWGECAGSAQPGVVYSGGLPTTKCALPHNVVTLASPRFPSGASRTVTINGLTAKVTAGADGGVSVYVPVLGNMRLNARGALAMKALGTLRRSPLASLGGRPRAVLPAGFRWREFGGIKFAAPAGWDDRHGTVSAACTVNVAPRTVQLTNSLPISGLDCAPLEAFRADYLSHAEGLVVMSGHAPPTPPASWPCVRSLYGLRLVCAQAPTGADTVYTLYLLPYGQRRATIMYFALGGSEETERAIIESIRPAPKHLAAPPRQSFLQGG